MIFLKKRRIFEENIEKLPLLSASTDIGNVSHIIPSLHPLIKVVSKGIIPHTKEFAKGVISEKADKTLIKESKLLALTAYQVMSDKNMLNKIIQEFKRYR
ncbi:MAG TPA: hypothetical protein VFC91_06500 [Atribacterota bacterium]|nr:hypothetical protein [Atribacterota bacterium]